MSEQKTDAHDKPITTGQSSQEAVEGDVSPGDQPDETSQGQSSEQDTTG